MTLTMAATVVTLYWKRMLEVDHRSRSRAAKMAAQKVAQLVRVVAATVVRVAAAAKAKALVLQRRAELTRVARAAAAVAVVAVAAKVPVLQRRSEVTRVARVAAVEVARVAAAVAAKALVLQPKHPPSDPTHIPTSIVTPVVKFVFFSVLNAAQLSSNHLCLSGGEGNALATLEGNQLCVRMSQTNISLELSSRIGGP
jgi:hypothetical protein